MDKLTNRDSTGLRSPGGNNTSNDLGEIGEAGIRVSAGEKEWNEDTSQKNSNFGASKRSVNIAGESDSVLSGLTQTRSQFNTAANGNAQSSPA